MYDEQYAVFGRIW